MKGSLRFVYNLYIQSIRNMLCKMLSTSHLTDLGRHANGSM